MKNPLECVIFLSITIKIIVMDIIILTIRRDEYISRVARRGGRVIIGLVKPNYFLIMKDLG